MFQLLHKYFVLNRKVAIPGIGIFYIQRQPAVLDFDKKAFVAPSSAIAFSQSAPDIDTKFFSFVGHEHGLTAEDAERSFREFSQTLIHRLEAERQVELPGLGSLSRNSLGIVQFKPVAQLPSFFPDAPVDRIAAKSVQSTVLSGEIHTTKDTGQVDDVAEPEMAIVKKSNWWVYAAILSAVAIVAIVYYYLQNGSLQ